MPMPSATSAGVLAEVDPVDHERDQVQAGRLAAHQLRRGGLGGGDEPARPADLLVAAAACSTACPAGSRPRNNGGTTARPASSPARAAQDLGADEQVIAGQAQLPGPVGGPTLGRLTGSRRPPKVTARPRCRAGTRPDLGCACRPGRTAAATSSANIGGHHLQAGAPRPGPQALLRRPGDLGHRHDHLLRNGDLRRRRSGWARRRIFWRRCSRRSLSFVG